MAVGGEAVDDPAADELGRHLLDVQPVVAEQRADVDLQQRAVLDQRPQPLMAAGRAIGVREQQAVAELREPLGGGREVVVEAVERALEQEPVGVLGTLRDQVQLALGEEERVLVRELAAGMQADVQALGVDRALRDGAALGELGEDDVVV
jgi:AcrR family transcriptional regulator